MLESGRPHAQAQDAKTSLGWASEFFVMSESFFLQFHGFSVHVWVFDVSLFSISQTRNYSCFHNLIPLDNLPIALCCSLPRCPIPRAVAQDPVLHTWSQRRRSIFPRQEGSRRALWQPRTSKANRESDTDNNWALGKRVRLAPSRCFGKFRFSRK